MSTFNGHIHEFPEIQVDCFGSYSKDGDSAVACFLSHIHSDHLRGLQGFRSPFIYCSAATKAMLLRLQIYPIRTNLARGILENPRMNTYKHLERLLKPLPLDTPTTLELWPGNQIQVTLLDANHCPGAVMFLFERPGKAVLYTGDIRCEPRMISAIAQNPCMIEYTMGMKTLDRIYLDTSIMKGYDIPTKAEGLRYLLEQVSKYPEDTIFHFPAWTWGYEEVWIALSKALGSKVHVDDYKMQVYSSLRTKSNDNRWAEQTHLCKEAPFLVGFTCANTQHDGCLTLDATARIHSCDKTLGCARLENPGGRRIVYVQPVVAESGEDGRIVPEAGLGGGGDDLFQLPEISEPILDAIMMTHKDSSINDKLRKDWESWVGAGKSGQLFYAKLAREGDLLDHRDDHDAIRSALIKNLKTQAYPELPVDGKQVDGSLNSLPNIIRFPFARHSSLPELRKLVKFFKPKDVWPCTVDASWHEEEIYIRQFFGDCCSGNVYAHDQLMEPVYEEARKARQRSRDGVEADFSDSSMDEMPSPVVPAADGTYPAGRDVITHAHDAHDAHDDHDGDSIDLGHLEMDTDAADYETDLQGDSQGSSLSDWAYQTRRAAFLAASSNLAGDNWQGLSLISTTDNHSSLDIELGETR
ncbi:hypothetical protein F4780DRAFT_14004 [Xylariomycetidae sp. FL0641]|nr:hypothetical protein F4780DRAFT_14004 [Xylariomycetidae sp. FL0641]